MANNTKRYDWKQIQEYYDTHGVSYTDISSKFGVSTQSIDKAIVRGDFVGIGHRETMQLSIVAAKLKRALELVWKTESHRMSRGKKHSVAVGKSTKGRYRENITNIYEVSSRTRRKIVERLELCCSICGWMEDVIDLHHIIAKKKGGTDNHSNLSPLCPNHHRLADREKIELDCLMTLESIIGDSWKEFYYG